jgi:dTDP-4-dehydrorhamnose reductase
VKNVLVIGANGQLGLSFQNVKDKYLSINFIFKTSSELDILKPNELNTILKEKSIRYCINCAAYTNVDKAEEEIDQSVLVNVVGAKNLAIACFNNKTTLVHVSTDFVFDGVSKTPYIEDDITNPLSVYGNSKLKGEQEIIKNLKTYFIIRTSWLYSEFGNNFLKTMLRIGDNTDEISVISDQIGTPTYAKDLVKVILNFIESDNITYGIYHYSNEGSCSWYEFAEEIFKLTNKKINLKKIKAKDYLNVATRPMFSVLNKSKIIKELNIEVPYWKDSLLKAITSSNR